MTKSPSFTATKASLLEAATIASRAVAGRTTMPILTHLGVVAKDDRLQITGTNMNVWLEVHTPAFVVQEGAIALPSKLLTGLIAAGSEQIEILPLESAVTLKSGKSKSKILGLDNDDMPVMPAFEHGARIELPAEKFTTMLRSVAFASSKNEAKGAVLLGVYFELGEEETNLVATDTYQLSVSSTPVHCDFPSNVIVPNDTISMVLNLLPKTGNVVIEVSKDEAQTAFSWGGEDLSVRLTTRLIAGKYANWRRVIKEPGDGLTVNRTELLAAFNQVALYADRSEVSFRAVMRVDGGTCSVSTDGRGGSSETILDAEVSNFPPLVGFNTWWMIEELKVLTGDTVRIVMPDPKKNALLYNPDDLSTRMLLNPILIEDPAENGAEE